MDAADVDRALVASAVPIAKRAAWNALLALDGRLGAILRTTREPMVGQMRLTWWYEALGALDRGDPPAEPVLRALAEEVVPIGVTGAALAGQVDAWELLLDGPELDDDALRRFAEARGVGLFAALAVVLGGDPGLVMDAGSAWALADLSRGLTHRNTAARAGDMARELVGEAFRQRWPRQLRPLGVLTLLGQSEVGVEASSPASPVRVGRLFWHRLTGR